MYNKSVLANGIRIVTESIPHLRSITLGIWVATGSRYEQSDNHGISHFIEHLLFKGTQNRSAKQIAELVDSIGGQINAFTGKEYTCYYIRTLDSQLELAMEIISDMLLNPRFAEDDIAKEQGVVLEEYNMYEDSPDELVHDLYVQQVWNQHALGRNILGTVDSIKAFTRPMVVSYYEQHYTPDKLVISVAGNLTHESVVKLAERYFSDLAKPTMKKASSTPLYLPNQSCRFKNTEQAHLCLGVLGLKQSAAEIYSMHILNNLLGGSMSSRLFQGIREEQGLAYSVYSYQSCYYDTGLMTVYAGTRQENIEQVIKLIWNNMVDLCDNNLSDAELSKAKEQLKGNLLLGLESSSSRMSRIGTLEMTIGNYLTLDEVVAKINQITVADINLLAKSLFQPELVSCCILGPIDNMNFDLE